MSESYAQRQIVRMDLHRRRSVLARMTETGETLKRVRIGNDVEACGRSWRGPGESPEVVLETTYG